MNVYIAPGELTLRLTRLTRNDILAGKGPRIHCSFRQYKRDPATAGRKRKQGAAAGPSRLAGAASAKRKRPHEYVEASEGDEEEMGGMTDEEDEIEDEEDFTNALRAIDEAPSSDAESDGDGDGDWEYSLRPSTGTSKKRKVSSPVKAPSRQVITRNLHADVILLSSD